MVCARGKVEGGVPKLVLGWRSNKGKHDGKLWAIMMVSVSQPSDLDLPHVEAVFQQPQSIPVQGFVIFENNHQSMKNANIDCQCPLSNLCRCKVKRRAFVLVHTPHVGLALRMDKFVIDFH